MIEHYKESLELAEYDFLAILFRAKMTVADIEFEKRIVSIFPENELIGKPYDRFMALGIKKDYHIESLIMALLRKADTFNFEKLNLMFPDIAHELRERYNAPRGILESNDSMMQI